MNIPILYEDDSLLVIDKPPGIVVNRADSVKEETVQDWVEKTYNIFIENRAGIVHRIDKETSGCLIIAKIIEAFFELQRQFKEREIHKTYCAIVHGALVPSEGEVRAPVGRLPWNKEHFGIVPGGKDSVTKYKVTSSHVSPEGEPLSFVELYPQTGRTHQIRVHMKYINHAIVGDYLYAGRKTARNDRLWAPRVMLHAMRVRFKHPVDEKLLAIDSPIPDDMNGIIHGST